IGVPFWGKGYSTEAARRVVRYAFEDLNLNRVYAHHMVRNPASGRVLEKIGMKREGLLRQRVRKWGVFEDVVWLAILQDDWRKLEGPSLWKAQPHRANQRGPRSGTEGAIRFQRFSSLPPFSTRYAPHCRS